MIDVYGTAAIVPFARLPEDRHPSAVIVDATHKRLYVSLASSPGLLGYNLETRTALEELPLDFTPVFFRTVRSGVFSMNPRTNDSDAFFVLDFQSEGQVFFIPPQN